MEISIINGTISQVSEEFTPVHNYILPSDVTVIGATKSYSSTYGRLILTDLTNTITIIATGEIIKTYYDLAQLFLTVGDRNIKVKATAPTVPDSNFSNQETYPLVYTITGTAINCTINNQSSCVKGAINNGTAIIPIEADGVTYYTPAFITINDQNIDANAGWVTISNKCDIKYDWLSGASGVIYLRNIINNVVFSLSGTDVSNGLILKSTSLDQRMKSLQFKTT